MLDEKALDMACGEWKRASELLFTRKDKVRTVIETYLEHANKHISIYDKVREYCSQLDVVEPFGPEHTKPNAYDVTVTSSQNPLDVFNEVDKAMQNAGILARPY